jgi:hypothetical protein
MTWVANKCGGARFRTFPDFRVEVEGYGVPMLAPGSPEQRVLAQTWKNWAPLIRKWSRIRTSECERARRTPGAPGCALLPPSNLLAILTQETGHLSSNKSAQAAAVNPSGAVGLMQIMPKSVFWPESDIHKLIASRNRANANHSVEIGSLLLQRHLGKQGGLPAAASNYNSGDVTCYNGKHVQNVFKWHHEQNYAYKATEYNNTAIAMGVNRPSLPEWVFVAGGVSLAGAFAWWRARR